MAQTSTTRRTSGKNAKNTTQKRQAAPTARQSASGRQSSNNRSNNSSGTSRTDNGKSHTGNGAGDSRPSTGRQQNGGTAGSRPKSNTMERGSHNSRGSASIARRSAADFNPENGQYLEKFFLDQLKDIYYAEQKIIQSLPKMQDAATTEELQEAFEDHLHLTQRHVKRLEKVFELLGQKAEGKKCEAIEGIAREVESIIDETEDNTMTRDAALIMAAQKVEHYEIATYGGLVQLAITMGQYDVAEILDRTLIEEEDADLLLTEIAECEINVMAEFEGGGREEGSEEDDEVEEEEEEGDETTQEKETPEEV